jgi:hypothetical protein
MLANRGQRSAGPPVNSMMEIVDGSMNATVSEKNGGG